MCELLEELLEEPNLLRAEIEGDLGIDKGGGHDLGSDAFMEVKLFGFVESEFDRKTFEVGESTDFTGPSRERFKY